MSDDKNVLTAPPYMKFWLSLSMGETVRILRGRKGWSAYQLASHMRKLEKDSIPIGTCHNIVKRAEANDSELMMSELIIIGEALGIGWDLHIKRNLPSEVKETNEQGL